MATLDIPRHLEDAFRQFSRDFNAVTRHWVEQGEETPETVAAAREGLREYLGAIDDTNADSTPRETRLRDVFDFWRARAASLPVQSIGLVPVQPTLSDKAETRIADRHWQRQSR